MIIKITLDEIKEIFKNAIHQQVYTVELYKLAIVRVALDWDDIEIMPFCGVPKARHKQIFDLAIDFDKIHHPMVMAGGMWMNNGFGVNDKLEFDDEVYVPISEIKHKTKESGG